NQKWACTSKTACSYSTTLRLGTWLANSRLSLAQIAKIMFCWSHKLPQKFAVVEAEIVEIDKSKFGKRKYNKGKRVEGQWVFGGVEEIQTKYFWYQCLISAYQTDNFE
ncbi:18529_t:CDS:2, partial [Racocetra persica]